ncbi:helix-turn-helix domain-containing protein [Tissierella pigra]|nr:helix-turn-helix transcriptional regulator [Tissierella pigra]MBU5427700.1 helix-turn-helix domain-containing protein [Tissierella pigra]
MFYDLASFGNYICKKRKDMSYTQKDIANLAFISTDALRRIENGNVLPNQITLEALSLVFKEDLNLALLSFRFDNQDKFFEVKKRLNIR